jgi:hypothetical protein
MKNIKLEKGLLGPDWWKRCIAVAVPGARDADPLPPDIPKEEKEKIIQGWKTVAVLQGDASKPFWVGFLAGDEVWILKYEVETLDGKFGMRIGGDEVRFFATDPALENSIQLSLVEIVQEDDSRYADLPLY